MTLFSAKLVAVFVFSLQLLDPTQT